MSFTPSIPTFDLSESSDPYVVVLEPEAKIKALLGMGKYKERPYDLLDFDPEGPKDTDTIKRIEKDIKWAYNHTLAAFLECISPEHAQTFADHSFLAGGCFVSSYFYETPSDYDFFFESKAAAMWCAAAFTSKDIFNGKHYSLQVLCRSANATTISISGNGCFIKIQLITRVCGDPMKVVDSFDFKHCKSFYSRSRDEMSVPMDKFADRQLEYNPGCARPVGALKRSYKFLRKGWKLPDEQLLAIAEAIRYSDPETKEDLKTIGSY